MSDDMYTFILISANKYIRADEHKSKSMLDGRTLSICTIPNSEHHPQSCMSLYDVRTSRSL